MIPLKIEAGMKVPVLDLLGQRYGLVEYAKKTLSLGGVFI